MAVFAPVSATPQASPTISSGNDPAPHFHLPIEEFMPLWGAVLTLTIPFNDLSRALMWDFHVNR